MAAQAHRGRGSIFWQPAVVYRVPRRSLARAYPVETEI